MKRNQSVFEQKEMNAANIARRIAYVCNVRPKPSNRAIVQT